MGRVVRETLTAIVTKVEAKGAVGGTDLIVAALGIIDGQIVELEGG